MPVINATVLTLLDWAKRLDPSGKIAGIAELLSQSNEILQDMPFIEGNLPTGHQSSIRTGLPAVYWRLLNQGVATSKSTTAQVTDQCGMLEAWSECDVDLAKLNGNVGAFRLSEAMAFIEAMNQEMAQTLFYGNSGAAPEEFNGLAVRYATLNTATTPSAANVLTGSGSGSDNSSIWLVGWGPNTVFGTFPKGSQSGLMHEDLGIVTIQDAVAIGTARMRAYQDHWQWKCGLVVKDWRYVVRIPNIDISNLVAKSSAADLVELMIKAIHRIPNLASCRPVFYMNRTCFQMLDIQRRDDVITGGGLTYENVDGKRMASFRGIPVRRCDALLETEATIS